MTKVKMNITASHKDIFFDCLNHAGDHDVCTIVSTLCNVLVAECIRVDTRPTVYEEAHVRIDLDYVSPMTEAVFKDVYRVFEGLQENHPDMVKLY